MEQLKASVRENKLEAQDEQAEDEDLPEFDAETTTTNTTGDSRGSGGKRARAFHDSLINNEDEAVRKSKLLVACSVILCAIAVGTAIYIFARQSDEKSFKIAFDGFASDIISIVQWDIQNNFALMQQVSAATTGTALMMNVSFPFFTQQNFETAAGYADGMGGIMAVGYAPIVSPNNRYMWELYATKNQGWIRDSMNLRVWHPSHTDAVHGTFQDHEHDRQRKLNQIGEPNLPLISETIFRWVEGTKVVEPWDPNRDYLPLWQVTPPDATPVNADIFSDSRMVELYNHMLAMNNSVLTGFTQIHDFWDWMFDKNEKHLKSEPHMFLMEAVYNRFEPPTSLVGVLVGLSSWANIFNRLLPDNTDGIICVVRDTCGQDFTYLLNGQKSIFLGVGDLHDAKFDEMGSMVQLELYEKILDDICIHHLYVYPSNDFKELYMTNKPIVYTVVVSLAFVLTTAVFLIYDAMVTKRQDKTMESAIRNNNVVASLFPEHIRDRIIEDADKRKGTRAKNAFKRDQIDDDSSEISDRPIADFVPIVTIMSADLAGFTPWSSAREPFQVFQLLEIVYGALDGIAKKRRIFKVETVGDCYVAVTNLPEPRKDHATAMARFARDSILEISSQVKRLEILFGPDTGDLGFRVGLHSGAVTAGVLRGDNARYQLFGDNMNTAAQIKVTSASNRVHVSQETADLLIENGKQHWLRVRNDQVIAEGKGQINSYWLVIGGEGSSGSRQSGSNHIRPQLTLGNQSMNADSKDAKEIFSGTDFVKDLSRHSEKQKRLVDWNAAVLLERIKMVVAKRKGIKRDKVIVPNSILVQLNQFVTGIAAMYRDNPFHNFEHASHVAMSVTKVLSRVTSGEELQSAEYTKDIASDPHIQLATLLSALIHDVDHQGIPNTQLIEEDPFMALTYDYRSVAENNSISISWSFFNHSEFDDLREFICPTKEEYDGLRDIVTKVVLATDIMDKNLKDERNARWEKVFGEESKNAHNINQIKAHIVLEHIIQASDVCHTMQHWNIYRKWNERLFVESYKAYRDGRSKKDPAGSWYEGEIGFFDFYIIPLAKKLDECGVFGVSSDEFLNYAYHNRSEWKHCGKEVVAEYVDKYCNDDD